MSYALASLSDQPKDTAFGKPIPLTKLGGGCPRHVLGDHALDRLSPQPLADPTFSASVRAPNRLSRRRTPCVRQQGRVQFESPQADYCSALSERISLAAALWWRILDQLPETPTKNPQLLSSSPGPE
jgi:hypothetical protein